MHVQLKHLASINLDVSIRAMLKDVLFRFATSASLSHGQVKAVQAYSISQPDKPEGLLSEAAVAILLYNRY